MPTTFTTSFPVARCCTGTKRVVGSDPPKIMRFLQLSLQKSPREATFVAHCLSGSGGGRSLFIDPSGKGFSHSEERWRGLDGQKRQCLDRDHHPGPRRACPPRRHSIVGSAPGPRQGPGAALPLSYTRVGIDFHWRDLLHFFFMPTRAQHIAQLEGRLEDLKAGHRKRESQLRNKKAHLPALEEPSGRSERKQPKRTRLGSRSLPPQERHQRGDFGSSA